VAGEVGSFVIGTDVIGGAGAGSLPGTFNIVTGLKPAQGVVSLIGPQGHAATQQDSR